MEAAEPSAAENPAGINAATPVAAGAPSGAPPAAASAGQSSEDLSKWTDQALIPFFFFFYECFGSSSDTTVPTPQNNDN